MAALNSSEHASTRFLLSGTSVPTFYTLTLLHGKEEGERSTLSSLSDLSPEGWMEGGREGRCSKGSVLKAV